ncbi:hypothetical protein IOT31_004320 [Escherichia coli]|nr:hypothetical protein [Escherichia coli]EHK7497385.1 hypothetical protein [Escherichia coli]
MVESHLKNGDAYILDVKIDGSKRADAHIATILVKHEEFYEKQDGVITRAWIKIHYQNLTCKGDEQGLMFCGGYDGSSNFVSLSSTKMTHGYIFVGLNKLEGYGIGSFFMNEIVKWVKQWPESNVKPIALTDGLATPDNKERRNRFYEKFGLEFEYSSPERASGYSRVMLARNLVSFDSPPPNICVIKVEEYLYQMLKTERSLKLERMRLVRDQRELFEAQKHPIRWMFYMMFNNAKRSNIFLIISSVMLLAVLFWLKISAN